MNNLASVLLFGILILGGKVYADSCVSIDSCYEAKTLQTSFLRLASGSNRNHHFGEDGLILLLGKMNTQYAREHLIELTDYYFGDVADDALERAILSSDTKEMISAIKLKLESQSKCSTSIYKTNCRKPVELKTLLRRWLSELSARNS